MPLNNPARVTVTGGFEKATTATRSTKSVPANIVDVAILAEANANRKGLTLWNASTATVLIDVDVAPTLTSYMFKLEADGYYEIPYIYTGRVQALWSGAATGAINVRELT
jgi:hypothetical protein